MDRILLMLEHAENRRLLEAWLARSHAVLPAGTEDSLDTPFDLGIIDGRALSRLWERVQARRRAEQPVLLPFLLLTARHNVTMDSARVWQSVDELIVTPIEKVELEARVRILLRARRLSVQNAALHRQLEAELTRAAAVQASLLPDRCPVLPGFDLAARCLPAREVGGDFFDWQEPEPGVLTLTLGDVVGKGMPAALLMATIRATLRAVAHQNRPAATVDLAQRALATDFDRSGSFVTLFNAELEVTGRRLTYVDAGHGLVFIRRRDGAVAELLPRGLPLGIFPDERYEEGVVHLDPGDVLVLHSDGLIDACRDRPLTSAVLAGVLDSASGAEEIVERLVRLPGLAGPPPDDLTVVVLRCLESDEPVVVPAGMERMAAAVRTIPSRVASVASVRRWMADLLSAWAVSAEVASDLVLAVTELCTNIIRHGYRGEIEGEIQIHLTRGQDAIRVTVLDTAQPFSIAEAAAPPPEGLAEGGYGLFLIQRLVDEVSTESPGGRGNRTVLVKYERPRS